MRLAQVRAGAPRHLMLSFILLLLLPAAAVVWLGVLLIGQDRDLEVRQRRERRDSAADRAVAGIEQALAATERRLRENVVDIGIVRQDDAVAIEIGAGGVEARPREHLLYYPDLPQEVDAPPAEIAAVEAIEFGARDLARAEDAYRRIAASRSADVRAAALVGAARVARKRGRHGAALDAYAALGQLHDRRVLGLPADLVARRARCALLEELARESDLRRDAVALLDDLRAARWRIDRGTFDGYVNQAARWAGRDPGVPAAQRALAAAADWLWQQHAAGALPTTGRRSVRLDEHDVTLLWQRSPRGVVAIVAGPGFRDRHWLTGLRSAVPAPFVASIGANGDSEPAVDAVRRKAAETGLPWTVIVADAAGAGAADEFLGRRRLLVAGLSLVLVVVFAGGYQMARAVRREFAVASLQNDFVAAVSHEFRTPLTSLQQFTALLADEEEPPPAKRRAFYEAQRRAIERLGGLVESLLDFGRMEAGAKPYRLEPTAADAIVRSVVEGFRHDARAEGFTITYQNSANGLAVNADREALGRAVWNLLDNAVKYSASSRTIRVEVSRDEHAAFISVQDHGLGIPPHEQREIFEKFVRGDASRLHGIKGTGIGLAMVRHIVAAHGGRVDLRSVPGEGSTFTIALPRNA